MQGFYVSSGLLTPEHKQRIGPALWEFAWMIDHETREDGKVLKGAPIPLAQISSDLGQHNNTTSRNLNRLVTQGYISRDPHRGGAFSYTVLNSKKWKPEADSPHTKNGVTPPPPPHTKNGVTPHQEWCDPTPQMVRPHTTNGVGNKELDNETYRQRDKGNGNGKTNPPSLSLEKIPSQPSTSHIDWGLIAAGSLGNGGNGNGRYKPRMSADVERTLNNLSTMAKAGMSPQKVLKLAQDSLPETWLIYLNLRRSA